MKLFQQLLVAPAALGLVAPLAATAADINIGGVSDYSDTIQDVRSSSQFSDVYPTDWAFQALSGLIERHNCLAATPSGSMTRYEAAALLNECLGNVAQLNEEERRLYNEFAPELAVIKGRLDGLEARVGEFEAGQFSTTTKLTGKTAFVVGAVDRDNTGPVKTTQSDGALSFNYSTQLNLNTSFNGEDLLYTRIKTGNFSDSVFGSKTYGNYLSVTNSNEDILKVDKIWYQFPVGDNFTVWAGPKIENYYMLASSPSIYKPVFKQFALGGNAGAYAASTDGGFGAAWTQSVDDPSDARFAISSNYVSKDARKNTDGDGMLGDTQSKWLTKLEYGSPRWQVSFAIAKEMCDEAGHNDTKTCKSWQEYYATDIGNNAGTGNATSYSTRAYWKPEDVGAIPAIQVGYDIRDIDDDDTTEGAVEATAGWMVGLMWDDAFIDGNLAGVAFGSRSSATSQHGNENWASAVQQELAGGNFVWEAYYDFKVSDNIIVTPALFGGTDTSTGTDDDQFGGLVQTTFKF